jgi:hypothetical protein
VCNAFTTVCESVSKLICVKFILWASFIASSRPSASASRMEYSPLVQAAPACINCYLAAITAYNCASAQLSLISMHSNKICQASSSLSLHNSHSAGHCTWCWRSLFRVGRQLRHISQSRCLTFGGARICHKLLQSPFTSRNKFTKLHHN